MIKSITALLCGAFLLASCTPKNLNSENTLQNSGESCVAGYVETSPGKGTLDIFVPSAFEPDVQSIPNVSIEVAQEVTKDIGAC